MDEDSKDTSKINASTVTNAAKEVYEGKVALEAVERVGKNVNIKGVVHEVMYKDSFNVNPLNIIKGKKCVLTKATNACRDDLVVKQAGKVVGRMQLKDTAKSIGKTVKQVSSKKYAGTNLIGTKETKQAYDVCVKAGKATQKMKSSGISSATTARAGAKALGKIPKADVLVASAKGAGAMGAAISVGIEVVSSGSDWLDGEITTGEFACKVAKEGAGGGLSAAAATTAGSVATGAAATGLTSMGVGAGIAATAAPVVIGAVAAIVVGACVKKVFDSIID